jgi:uncharacterized membrane protein YdbT with pleckstrin-like domain
VGYIEDNLLPGERIVHRAYPHKIFFLWPGFFALITLLLMAAPFEGHWYAAAISAVPTVIASLSAWVKFSSAEYAVTNKRVIAKTGLVRRRTVETLLAKVEAVEVDQDILGRILGYGTITVTGTGGGRDTIVRVARPLELRKHIYHQIEGFLAQPR